MSSTSAMPTDGAYTAMLDALAAHAGLDAAELRVHQEISLDAKVVVLSRAGDALECVCEVLELPPDPPAPLLQLLLQANTLGRPTLGATLGVLSSRDLLVLSKRVPLDAPAVVAARACRDLATVSVAWAMLLAGQMAEASQPQA